jgi:hypothetical protein
MASVLGERGRETTEEEVVGWCRNYHSSGGGGRVATDRMCERTKKR